MLPDMTILPHVNLKSSMLIDRVYIVPIGDGRPGIRTDIIDNVYQFLYY